MKPVEEKPSTSKGDSLLRFDSLNKFKRSRGHGEAAKALETAMPREEVYALTTIKNFRGDNMEEFVFESDWVFVSREKLMEPRFQQHLAKSDALTSLCKTLAKRNFNKKVAEVKARPPCCHCSDLNSKQNGNKTSQVTACQRFLDALTKFWRRMCDRLKNSKLCIIKDNHDTAKGPNEISFTNNYLCRSFSKTNPVIF